MSNETDQPRADSAFTLWMGVLIAPAAYFLQLVVAYALIPWVCGGGGSYVLHLVTVTALALCTFGGWLAWRSWRRAGRGYPRDDNNVVSRAEFMAFGGLMLSALFFAAIIAQEIPTWIVDACV